MPLSFCQKRGYSASFLAAFLVAKKTKKEEESSFFWGDLMREATRLSRISFYFLDLSQEETCCVLISLCSNDYFLSFGTIISYLIAFERLFLISLCSNDCFGRNRRRKNLPARWRSRQESDRSGFRVIDRAKGVILPLDLGEYRFYHRGECRFDRHV